MSVTSLQSSIPVDFASQSPTFSPEMERKIAGYVTGWKRHLKHARTEKVTIWNECWQLFRGKDDLTEKEEWQSKLVLPKAWSSVKQATNVIKRLLRMSQKPYSIEATNPDDLITQMRSGQASDLTDVFLEKAKWQEEFGEGLECGFIMGLGVWKEWWGLKPRTITKVQPSYQPTPSGEMALTKQIVQQEIQEGQLYIKAVDPYNFYWLPGSKLNRWVGTLEEIELPKWELMRMAKQGIFPEEKIKSLQLQRIEENEKQSRLRFDETQINNGPTAETGVIKLTEFYGPVLIDGEMMEENAHIIVANDTTVLIFQANPFWHKKPPYIAFSPLALPFRTEGVGLVEMVREILRALSKLANLSIDTLVFRLAPVFEVVPDVYENPEDFETGLVPGKIFRRNLQYIGQPGIQPIAFEDISQGAVQVSAQLDRSHQEGALVSEIQQALPRYRGYQSAQEIGIKAENQDGFFSSMASDIERQALEPMVEMALDLTLQFIDTANDPRVASILGLNGDVLMGMSQPELMEMVQGDYKVTVRGLSGQLEKVEMLENLVQLMNLIGQNPQAWLPYINQNELLKRILEAFRPAIRDIDNIIVTPEQAAAREIAQTTRELSPEILAQLPQIVAQATALKQQEFDNMMRMREMEMQAQQQKAMEAQAKAEASKPSTQSKGNE